MLHHAILLLLLLLMLVDPGVCCHSEWSVRGGRCYRAFVTPFDVSLARSLCQLFDGDLVRVSDEPTFLYVQSLPGFRDEESYWLKENSAIGNVSSEPGECPYAYAKTIRLASCSEKKRFVCEGAGERTSESCHDSELYGSLCYVVVNSYIEYAGSAGMCASHGARLAVLDDPEKERHGKAMTVSNEGLYWVGAKKRGDGHFKWDGGGAFQPSCPTCTHLEQGDCVALKVDKDHPTMFGWMGLNCSNMARALCEKLPQGNFTLAPTLSTTTTTTTTTTTSTTTTTTTTTPEPELYCPHGNNWKAHPVSGYCYWETTYETGRRNWNEARQFCGHYGGDLASYGDREQEEIGLGNAAGHFRGLWIGLKRGPTDDVFRWSDGSPVRYTRWARNEPRNSSSKFCVTHGPGDSAWMLDYCGARRWFVCRAPKTARPYIPDIVENRAPACRVEGDGAQYEWRQSGAHCYLVYDVAKYSWGTAKTFCEDNGARLASVHSFAETDFILLAAGNVQGVDFWIGLNAQGLYSAFEWADGTPVDFLYWSDDVRVNATVRVDTCVTFDDREGSWKPEVCNRMRGVICKRPANGSYEAATPAPTPFVPGFCSEGWYSLGNRCYKGFGRRPVERKRYQVARNSCQEEGGTLASVHSRDEQDLLTDVLLQIGVASWIGLHTTDRGTLFQWDDQSLLDYADWNEDEPTSEGLSEETCVSMAFAAEDMGKWHNDKCYFTKGYICQKAKDPTLSQPPPNPFSCGDLPDGRRLGDSCFSFFKDGAPWLAAQGHCRQFRANLVSVENVAVGVFLQRKFRALKSPDGVFWSGMREFRENQYEWLSSRKLHYSNWLRGQPQSVSHSMENCVALDANAFWMVRHCYEPHPYACEFQTEPDGPTQNRGNLLCPNSTHWRDLGGDRCFLFKPALQVTWNHAMKYCFDHGGALASFHSQDEVRTILDTIDMDDVVVHALHIGLGKRRDGTYAWVDHSPVDFTYWDEDEPNHPDYSCVRMYVDSGKWNDIDCDGTHIGFICSAAKVETGEVQFSSNNTDRQKAEVEHDLAAGGIFGIVLCVLVVVAVVSVAAYYLCPSTRMRPQRLQSESPEA